MEKLHVFFYGNEDHVTKVCGQLLAGINANFTSEHDKIEKGKKKKRRSYAWTATEWFPLCLLLTIQT